MEHVIGKKFEVPKDIKEFIKKTNNSINSHKLAMNHHARECHKQIDILWETLKEKIPEVSSPKYIYQYNDKDHTVECIGVSGADDSDEE